MPYVKTTGNSRKSSKRSRTAKRRRIVTATILAAICVIAVLIVRARMQSTPVVEHARAPENRVPVATPAPQWRPAELARLRASLRDGFAPALQGADRYSLAIVGARGEMLYDDRGEQAVTPASVAKLIVADASLNLLGPRFRFQTIAAAQRAIESDGTLHSNLWIVGSGDPSLRSDDLRSGITTLARSGLRRIDGVAMVDPSAMRGPEINPHWNVQDANEDFQTPISAVSIDGDTAEFRVYGTTPGAPARVVILPPSGGVRTFGSVQTSSGYDSVVIAATQAPNEFRLDGAIPAGAEEKFWLPVHGIPRYVGAVVDRMLRDARIATSAPAGVGAAPLDAIVLWEHRSLPLVQLVRHMLYLSDNHYAEQLLRALGSDAGSDASDSAGIVAETQFLASRGVPTPGLRLVDGSGLAHADRVAALTLARLLSDAELRDGGAELYPLLPQGGREGTLKDYDFTTALGRVRAKSGHLSGVDSLAGYVTTAHHGRVAFAFLINGSPGDPDAAIVRAVDRIAAY